MTTPHRIRRTVGVALALAALGAAIPAAAQARPAASGAGVPAERWTTATTGRQVNVTHRSGALRVADPHQAPAAAGGRRGYGSVTLAVHRLRRPETRVGATPRATTPRGASVAVDVRGRSGGGDWTGWVPARADSPALFSLPVETVQARITLTTGPHGASPAVRGVRFTADRVEAAARPRVATAAHVFATREGLVGGTTANGHVIVANDHFVALPSARGLSPKDTTDYSVHVCNPATGACVDAPVWDIGPWNTHDDYWSPSEARENWQDLPQGTPEAQAAYQDGYNGGLDEFGRAVANPAGIDLADGTFADLGLTDNGYVDVTYLWTVN